MIEKRPKLLKDIDYPNRATLKAGTIAQHSNDNVGSWKLWQGDGKACFEFGNGFVGSYLGTYLAWIDFCTDCQREVCGIPVGSRHYDRDGCPSLCHGHEPKYAPCCSTCGWSTCPCGARPIKPLCPDASIFDATRDPDTRTGFSEMFCPFCGERAGLMFNDRGFSGTVKAGCSRCGIWTGHFPKQPRDDDPSEGAQRLAIAAWNRRPVKP